MTTRSKYASTFILTMALSLPAVSNAVIKLSFYGANFVTVGGSTSRYPKYPRIETDLVREGGKAVLHLREPVTFGFDQLVPGANWTSNDKLAGSIFRIKRIELDVTKHPEIAEILAAVSDLGSDDVLQFPEKFHQILYPQTTNRLTPSTELPALPTPMDPRMFRLSHYVVTVDALGMAHNGTSVRDETLVHPGLRAFFDEVTHSSGMVALGNGPTAYVAELARLLPHSMVRNLSDRSLALTLDAEFAIRLARFREEKRRYGFTNPDPILDGDKVNGKCGEALVGGTRQLTNGGEGGI